jgi:acyl dehydratase
MTINTPADRALPTVISLADIEESVGVELGPGPWLTVEQDRIDAFAEATGDHQWIHVDRERAAAGPFGRTIAHGYLTLSLVAAMMGDVIEVTDRSSGINYGIDKVRFVTPVREGSRIRMRGSVLAAEPRSGGMQYRLGLSIEIEGVEKPAMVGEFIVLAYP